MKKYRRLTVILVLAFILAGCDSNKVGSSTEEIPETTVENGSADTEITERGAHSGEYAIEYFYNGLCWIWQS